MLDAIMNLEPNWHPVFVHFVVGLLLTAAIALTVVALAPQSWQRRGSLQAAGDWMLAIGIAAALAAVAAGFQAYYTVAHDGPSHAAMTEHRNWALATTAVFLLIGLWRLMGRERTPSILFAVALVAAAALLISTGWHGGRLVFHHGLGVTSLPEAEGPGHAHDHGDGHDHGDAHAQGDEAAGTPEGEAVDDPEPDDGHDHEHDDHGSAQDDGSVSSGPSSADDLSGLEPSAVVAAFHNALERQDEAMVRRLLLPEVFIFESGNAERSLNDYAGHHMPADMEFSASVERTVRDRQVLENGDVAWVLTESINEGTFRAQPIHVRVMETMILRRTEAGWRIAHIHWSSSRIAEEPASHGDHDDADGHDHEH